MNEPTEIMPKFLFNLRHDVTSNQFIASLSIVDPIVTGFRGVIRRFNSVDDVVAAFTLVRIAPQRYASTLSSIHDGQCHSFEIDVNEGQKLDILHIDTTE